MIDIIDYRYHILCDFENKNLAKHSIGQHNAPMAIRSNICHQCLKEIISEGLKLLTEEERVEVLRDYIPESKGISEEEKEELRKKFLAEYEEQQKNIKAENQTEEGQAEDNKECMTDSLEEHTSEEKQKEDELINKEESDAQKLSERKETYDPAGKPRDELISKAKELGVKGKISTFTNKMLEKEILKKLGGK